MAKKVLAIIVAGGGVKGFLLPPHWCKWGMASSAACECGA